MKKIGKFYINSLMCLVISGMNVQAKMVRQDQDKVITKDFLKKLNFFIMTPESFVYSSELTPKDADKVQRNLSGDKFDIQQSINYLQGELAFRNKDYLKAYNIYNYLMQEMVKRKVDPIRIYKIRYKVNECVKQSKGEIAFRGVLKGGISGFTQRTDAVSIFMNQKYDSSETEYKIDLSKNSYELNDLEPGAYKLQIVYEIGDKKKRLFFENVIVDESGENLFDICFEGVKLNESIIRDNVILSWIGLFDPKRYEFIEVRLKSDKESLGELIRLPSQATSVDVTKLIRKGETYSWSLSVYPKGFVHGKANKEMYKKVILVESNEVLMLK